MAEVRALTSQLAEAAHHINAAVDDIVSPGCEGINAAVDGIVSPGCEGINATVDGIVSPGCEGINRMVYIAGLWGYEYPDINMRVMRVYYSVCEGVNALQWVFK